MASIKSKTRDPMKHKPIIDYNVIPNHIKVTEENGAKYFEKISQGPTMPRNHMLAMRETLGHTLAVGFQLSEKNRIYASYPMIADFLTMYQRKEQERMFYEILYGAVHTYADLEWTLNELSTKETVVSAFIRMFKIVMPLFLGVKPTDNFIWSTITSTSQNKCSLHFKYEHRDTCWENVEAQQAFWTMVFTYLKEDRVNFPELFVRDECIINAAVYTPNQARRCIYSHRYGSDRIFVPYGQTLEIVNYFVTVESTAGKEYFEIKEFAEIMDIISQITSKDTMNKKSGNVFVERVQDIIKVMHTGQLCYVWSHETKLWGKIPCEYAAGMVSDAIDNEYSYDTCDELLQKFIHELKCREFIKRVDCDKDLIPIKNNMVVDLKTGLQRNRTKEDCFSFECHVSLCTDQTQLSIVNNFMMDIANGSVEMKRYLQKFLGYCLTGHTTENAMFVWCGAKENGKGALHRIMSQILEKFHAHTHTADIGPPTISEHDSYSTAPFLGTRAYFFRDHQLNGRQIKSFVTGDAIQLSNLEIDYRHSCKLILRTRIDPALIQNQDHVCVIPFYAKFSSDPEDGERLQNDELVDLMCEKYLDAFFTWVVQGSVAWYADGLGQVPAIIPADDIVLYIDSKCHSFNGDMQKLYDDYMLWAYQNGMKLKSMKLFVDDLAVKYIQTRDQNGGICFKLKPVSVILADSVAQPISIVQPMKSIRAVRAPTLKATKSKKLLNLNW
jgi:hypothetical protein